MSDAPDPLELFLAERDAPCPGCGYNLRGLKGSTCPECKRATSLEIAADHMAGLRPLVVAALWMLILAVIANGVMSCISWFQIYLRFGRLPSAFVISATVVTWLVLAISIPTVLSLHGLLRTHKVATLGATKRLIVCVVLVHAVALLSAAARWLGFV